MVMDQLRVTSKYIQTPARVVSSYQRSPDKELTQNQPNNHLDLQSVSVTKYKVCKLIILFYRYTRVTERLRERKLSKEDLLTSLIAPPATVGIGALYPDLYTCL